MDLKSGEIYFVRERNGSSFGPYVKIGLVRGVRDSLARLKEHQTGNPRSLYIDELQVIRTDAVDQVEAQMHKIFAPRRVSGEWFEFPSEQDIEVAVAKARELAEEVGALMPVFNAANELLSQTSNTTKIPASQEALMLAAEVANANGELAVCKELNETIRTKMLEAINDEKGEIKGTAELKERTFKGKLMVDDLRLENPELYERYVELVETWYQRFDTTAKKLGRDELTQEFLDQSNEIERLVKHVESVDEAYKLIEPILLLTKLKARSTWNLDIATAKLKVLCGLNAGIEDVCTWPRRFKDPQPVFNEKLFVTENPELYLDYLAEAKTGTWLKFAKRKA